LLFIHGTSDHVVPHEMSDQLLADAITVRAEYKQVVKIEGGHHGTIFMGGPFYDQAVRNFARTATEAAILGAGVAVSAAPH